MKKLIFAIFLMLAFITFYSCDSSKKKLQSGIETVNKECPIDLGMIGEISSLEFDEEANEVIMTMTISKELPLKISALNKLKNTLKRNMLGAWAKSESGIILMKEIAKADSKFTMVIQAEESNESLKINVSKNEIKDLAEGKVDPISPRDMLEIMITSTNTQCPMQIENGMIMSSVSLEGNNFVYNYSVDENLVSIEAIKQNKSAVKANIKQILSSNDMTVKQMVKICKEANTGIVYRYIGDVSGDVCIIKFSSSEL